MDGTKALIDLENPKSIAELLREPTIKISEFLTGLIISDKNDYKLSAGHLVQAAIKCNLLQQFGREIKHYREKGKIKEDFFSTDKQRATLRELLEFIDKEAPDEDRFKAMKSIFFATISKDSTGPDEILGYELMQICKKLTSNDVVLLKTAYSVYIGGSSAPIEETTRPREATAWFNIIAEKIGHKLPALAELSEQNLMDLKLIGRRRYPDGSGLYNQESFRLTDLGIKLCEFITEYQ
ncbi:MAG: hypothetical protein PHI58_01940 [Candidatus Omnitrophica bacterium]|nr:hypothetical protein [Candidatus Omnitrophota bacterium]